MHGIVFFLTAAMGIFLAGMMLVQGLSRKVDFFSIRNLYLTSFIVYQIASPCYVMYTENFSFFKVYSPEQACRKFVVFLYLYVVVFLFSYHRLKLTSWAARKCSGPPKEMSDSFFLGVAMMLVCVALPLRFLGPSIPLIAAASTQVSIAMAAVASAIAGWVWGNRRFNPAVVTMMVIIVGASLFIGISGVFGRRPLLTILLGLAWGAYHRRFKMMSPKSMVLNILPLVVFAAVAVSAFTAIRNNRTTAQNKVQETVREMAQANVGAGAHNIVTGQTCGAASLWCMENYPDRIEPKFFHTFRVLVCWYVPKAWWPEKPVPLGNFVATLARVDQVNRDKLTLPPGVLGYAAAEGGLIAAFFYALFYGQFLRFFDELVRLNPTNPFIILPIGCSTGQVLGLARGCIAIFADLVVLGFVATFLFLYVTSKIFGSRTPQTYYAPWPQTR